MKMFEYHHFLVFFFLSFPFFFIYSLSSLSSSLSFSSSSSSFSSLHHYHIPSFLTSFFPFLFPPYLLISLPPYLHTSFLPSFSPSLLSPLTDPKAEMDVMKKKKREKREWGKKEGNLGLIVSVSVLIKVFSLLL